MRCYVSGANGFMGAALVRRLLDRGFDVTAVVGADMDLASLEGLPIRVREMDVRNEASVRSALAGGEWLFHAAACYSFWRPRRADIYDINVTGTQNVLAAAHFHAYRRVIHTSSAGTLMPGWGQGEEINEDALFDFSRFQGDYKCSKLMADILVLRAAAAGLPAMMVHPTVVLGPGDRRPTPTGQMIVHHLCGRMSAFVDMAMNIVDVDDVAEGQVLAAMRGRPGGRYILGGENLSLHDVMQLLSDMTGIAAPRVRLSPHLLLWIGRINEWMAERGWVREPMAFVEAALHAMGSRSCSIRKAQRDLGYAPRPARLALARAAAAFAQQGHDRLLTPERKRALYALGQEANQPLRPRLALSPPQRALETHL